MAQLVSKNEFLEEDSHFNIRLLAEAQSVAHIGIWQWQLGGDVKWSKELYQIYGETPASYRPTYEGYLTKVHPEDRKRVADVLRNSFTEKVSFTQDERILRPDGTLRHLHTWGYPILDQNGNLERFVGVCQDITDRVAAEEKLHVSEERLRRHEILLTAQRDVFDLLNAGGTLRQALTILVLAIEKILDGVIASVLLLDEEGLHVSTGAGPSLPESYNSAIDGQPIGPHAGSCGTAAYTRKMVIVEDTQTDPRWAPYKEVAKKYDLHACWSNPIINREGRVLGTFAMYFRDVLPNVKSIWSSTPPVRRPSPSNMFA
jgi:PAS domain S-box-containing protein